MSNNFFFELVIAVLYIALGIVPFIYARYYPFLDKLRFSKGNTAFIFLILVFFNMYIFIEIENKGSCFGIKDGEIFRLCFFAIDFIFYCISIKENFFKHVLVYLVCFMFAFALTTTFYIINKSVHLNVPYFPYVLIMTALLFLFTVLNFMFTKKILTPLVQQADTKTAGLVCFVLFIIMIITGVSTYDLSLYQGLSVKYIIIRAFSFLGTIGAIVILKILVEEYQNNRILLEEHNRQEIMFAIQKEQFYYLFKKIEEAKRIRHDLKHHFAAIQSFLSQRKYDKLSEYIRKENTFVPNDEKIIFSENAVINAILSYYYKKANDTDIQMEVRASIPSKLKMEDTELWVLFGNLLENAIEGCEKIKDGERKIKVKVYYKDGTLFIVVDNMADKEFIRASFDGFVSSKNSDMHGIGIESICFLAKKLGGKADFKIKDGWFLASVYIKT